MELFCMSLVFSVVFSTVYGNKLDKAEDEYMNRLNDNTKEYVAIIDDWKESYNALNDKYAKKILEVDQLNTKVEELYNTIEIPTYTYTKDDVVLLAKVVQCEAGDYDTCSVAQKYVAQVILNRVHSGEFPNTIKDVVYQENNGVAQFSVVSNGMLDNCVLDQRTLENVYEVIVHGVNLPEYVLYFYDENVTDNWVNFALEPYIIKDGTVFAYEKGGDVSD